MNEQIAAVMDAWNNGTDHQTSTTLWTDGEHVYHRDTALLAFNNGLTVLNLTSYGPEVAEVQAGVLEWLESEHFKFDTVAAVYYGADADGLLNAYEHRTAWRVVGGAIPPENDDPAVVVSCAS